MILKKRSLFFAILCFSKLDITVGNTSTKNTNKVYIAHKAIVYETNSDQKWDEMSKHLILMMESGLKRENTIRVTIYGLFGIKKLYAYSGFFQSLFDLENNKVNFNLHTIESETVHKVYRDYLVLLFHESMTGYTKYFINIFTKLFPDRSSKIILIINSFNSLNHVTESWTTLLNLKYFNVYIIIHQNSGIFQVTRTEIVKSAVNTIMIRLRNAYEKKFLLMGETLKGDEISYIRTVHFDTYPASYVKNNKIIGADGDLIDEFSKLLHIPYQIINKNRSYVAIDEIYNLIETVGDISLYTHAYVQSSNVKTLWHTEMSGICLLVPRNIPVSTHENYTLPLDNETLIMSIISTICIILCWRLITNEMSILSILIATYELMLNLGASGLDHLTFRENILVYCFIFSSFIMVSFYESFFISFMLAKSTMRSAKDISELNATDTKFYSYFDDNILSHSNFPKIRDELIINTIDVMKTNSFDIPTDLDENLVYLVHSSYADTFIQSERNYRTGTRLFDKMIINNYYNTYNVHSSFFYVNKFTDFFTKVMESGIYKYWKQKHNENFKSFKVGSDASTESYDMSVPLFILTIGCSVALAFFLIEIAVYRWKLCCINRVRYLQNNISTYTRRKKINLDKWKKRYIYNKRLKTKKQKTVDSENELQAVLALNKHREFLRCRESVGGNYLVFERFKKVKRMNKSKRKIIQVQPFLGESSI